MAAKIVPLMPNAERYVEVFGGGASVLLARDPSGVETYNDLDRSLYDFFSVLSDPDKFLLFKRRVEALPVSRDFYNEYRSGWENEPDQIKRVAMWFYVARLSFSGRFGESVGYSVSESRRNMAISSSRWLSAIDRLPAIHARLQRVQIENNDWRDVIDTHDDKDCLFYLDPPYIMSTRKSGGYAHELTDGDHADLVERLRTLKGSFVLSGYNSDIYAQLNEFSRRYDFKTACHAAGRTKGSGLKGKGSALKIQARTECLWVKESAPSQLSIWGKK